MSVVELDVHGAVATVWLNRPDQRNAVDLAMCDALVATADALTTRDDVHVVILRARGSAFCAGADLKERTGMDAAAVRARRLRGFDAYDALEALPMPVVGVVHGPAVGAGCEIVAACDFAVATPAASFRTPEAVKGTIGATQRLPRILGLRLAKDLMFTGRTLSADEAHAAGLVTRIVSPETLDTEINALAAAIAGASPRAMALAKQCTGVSARDGRSAARAAETAAIDALLADPDAARGLLTLGEPRRS